MQHQKIIVLDFGGQYAHLITSRIRRNQILAEIWPSDTPIEKFKEENVIGIILSGGPQSVYEKDSPSCDTAIFDLGIPVLGICYGHQFLCHSLGGEVTPGTVKEYGRAALTHKLHIDLFEGISQTSTFWMSHGDEVTKIPEGFEVIGSTADCANAAIMNTERQLYGIQFHPEVTHSVFGAELLANFCLKICNAKQDWDIATFYQELESEMIEKVGDRNVMMFVSGGVDSTVGFSLLTKILGPDRVRGIFVDNGLLRHGEVDFVEKSLRDIGANLTTLHEANYFLGKLEGQTEPEAKREIIGHAFLAVQKKYFEKNNIDPEKWLLGQGTIYPDTIETGGTAHAEKIKTHHNRAPEVQALIDAGKVIEPLAALYKDEVRELGRYLELPTQLIERHPFPGPGLGVRLLGADSPEEVKIGDKKNPFVSLCQGKTFQILPIKSVGVQGDARTYSHPALIKNIKFIRDDEGNLSIEKMEEITTKFINHHREINRCIYKIDGQCTDLLYQINRYKSSTTPDRVTRLQRADDIVTKKLTEYNLYDKVWQFPVIMVPLGLNQKGTESIILRPVESMDAMSASVAKLPIDFFEDVAQEILKDKEISSVLLDTTSKPPGTIEWE